MNVGFKKDGTPRLSKAIDKAVMSHASVEWGTPQDLFDAISESVGGFDLDAAASDKKHVCDNYFTAETDALSKEWHGKVWLNPPFGHGVEQWFEKVVNEVHTNADSVHVLIPARTDTRWFHEWVMPFATEIYFFKGRLYYVNEKGENKNPAAFPSMLCVFRKKTGSCGDVPTIKASSRDGSAFREAVEWL